MNTMRTKKNRPTSLVLLYEVLNAGKKRKTSRDLQRRRVVQVAKMFFARLSQKEDAGKILNEVTVTHDVDPVVFCDVLLRRLPFYLGGYPLLDDQSMRVVLRQVRREAIAAAASSSSDSQ